jgi:hypothetical protein
MEPLRASWLTAEAARRLRRARGTGRVHSAFARTVNVELDSLGDGSWVSLHGPGPIPAPFGIECEGWPVTAGLAGASARVEAHAIILDGGLRIRLDGARVLDTALPTPTPLPAVSRCFTVALARVAAGFLPAASALLMGGTSPIDPLSRVALPALSRLGAATSARDPAGCLAAARSLLGLGPGLTPAGDDCLVGWLAGAWTAGAGGRHLVDATGPGLLVAATDLTGRLSRAFLAAAVRGEVAEPVHGFALLPDEARLAGLLAQGATSGADLLAGYLLARAALEPSSLCLPCPNGAPHLFSSPQWGEVG